MSVNSITPGAAPVQSTKKSGGAGKAVASAFVPGLGQFCDGRIGDGFGYLLGTAGVLYTGVSLIKENRAAAEKAIDSVVFSNKPTAMRILANLPKGSKLGLAALAVGVGVWVRNIVDAYKGKR